ncbi:hypothetical protein M0R04_15630 [Candidatus Dojkabacteria bacterium]|jgi:hypothetical protein|nr:hypothetical protein [Candidatus Dojkabacteria bacterium]
MPNKQIYLSESLMEAAKLESNFSEIISNLYTDYLNSKRSKEELITEAEKLENKKQEIIKDMDKEIKDIETEIKITEIEEKKTFESEEEKKHKLANRISECQRLTNDIFHVLLTESEVVEYLDGSYETIEEYLIKKRFI